MSTDEVLNSGYYEMHRLASMIMEAKSFDYMMLSRALDNPNCQKEDREEFWTMLRKSQPRRFQVNLVSPEIIASLRKAFSGRPGK